MNPLVLSLLDPEFADLNLDHHVLQSHMDDGAERIAKGVPLRYVDAIPEHPEVRDWVSSLVRGAAKHRSGVPRIRSGSSIHLMGFVGCGKTHQAYGALRALSASGALVQWRFVTAANFVGALRPRQGVDSEKTYEDYARCAVLVLDDLGAEKGTEWTVECLYRLIDDRYVHMLPTLITSNLDPLLLAEQLGDRIVSRLREMCTRITFTGDDRRKPPQ